MERNLTTVALCKPPQLALHRRETISNRKQVRDEHKLMLLLALECKEANAVQHVRKQLLIWVPLHLLHVEGSIEVSWRREPILQRLRLTGFT